MHECVTFFNKNATLDDAEENHTINRVHCVSTTENRWVDFIAWDLIGDSKWLMEFSNVAFKVEPFYSKS